MTRLAVARPRARTRWRGPVLPDAGAGAAAQSLAAALHLPESLSALLVARGLADPATARRFLDPALADLHPPSLLHGLDDAVGRIVDAIRRGERIFVHGDYDVDGITSTVFLTRALRALGATVEPFVPHRVRDGYDLSDAGVRAAIAGRASLVITCDCGTTAVEPVRALKDAGIDTIISDHHLHTGAFPDAVAILNPRHPECRYPDKELVAGGVAFKLALGVTQALAGDEAALFGMLDLVALATVADVAPLRGENRVLVRHGLRQMAQSRLPGMRAMLRASGLDAKELTAGRIGFILAPRLNAAGRVGTAMRGVELLLTDDDGTAMGIARELEELNRRRQEIDRATLDEARVQLDRVDLDQAYGLVLAGEGWHPGVIGIVASRVVEETARPTLMVAVDGGVGKGSGRSIPAFDLHSALTECSDLLLRYGGHRAAAGITIEAGRIDEFRERFNAVAASRLTPDDLAHDLRIDVELPLADATEDLLAAMRQFEPYGMGNPSPVFVARGVRAAAAPRRIGDTGIRTRLGDGRAALDALAWDFAHRVGDIDWLQPFDVAFRLERDEWQGRARLQARIADVRQ